MFGHPIYWNNRTVWWQFKFFFNSVNCSFEPRTLSNCSQIKKIHVHKLCFLAKEQKSLKIVLKWDLFNGSADIWGLF